MSVEILKDCVLVREITNVAGLSYMYFKNNRDKDLTAKVGSLSVLPRSLCPEKHLPAYEKCHNLQGLTPVSMVTRELYCGSRQPVTKIYGAKVIKVQNRLFYKLPENIKRLIYKHKKPGWIMSFAKRRDSDLFDDYELINSHRILGIYKV